MFKNQVQSFISIMFIGHFTDTSLLTFKHHTLSSICLFFTIIFIYFIYKASNDYFISWYHFVHHSIRSPLVGLPPKLEGKPYLPTRGRTNKASYACLPFTIIN